MEKQKIALCAIVKDEGRYIEEWAAFHLGIGFDDIFIYDNDGHDFDFRLFSKRKWRKRVHVKPWPKKDGVPPQAPAYNDFLHHYGVHYDWVMFLDIDEFLNLKNCSDIFQFLKDFEDCDGITINWRIFGSAGLKEYARDLVLRRFRRAAHQDFVANQHVKTIFRPNKVNGASIHLPSFKPDTRVVTAQGRPIDSATGPLQSPVDFSSAQINHYFTKSLGEFRLKRARGRADIDQIRDEADFVGHDKNDVVDESILRHMGNITKFLPLGRRLTKVWLSMAEFRLGRAH